VSEWLSWQIVDSAFPTGAFAHSYGLEAAWQHREVTDQATLRAFVDSVIVQTAYSVLPFVNEAFQTPARIERLDVLANAFLTNPVGNRASRTQGRTLAATAARIWPSDSMRGLKARADNTCAHLAPIAGATFALLGLQIGTAQRIMLFTAARGVLSAAVRLGIVGSYEAQRMQLASEPSLDRVAARCRNLTTEDLAQTAPFVDLLQSAHDRLYSRLFQS
jgi:urease accessory protein